MININTHFFLEALHVVFMTAYCTLRNETKRNETNQNETNQNETNQNETKQTKPTKTKPTKTKPNKTKQNKTKPHKTKPNFADYLLVSKIAPRKLREMVERWTSLCTLKQPKRWHERFLPWLSSAYKFPAKSRTCDRILITSRILPRQERIAYYSSQSHGLLYFAKRNETKWNLYFAKWKSVLCEMKICNFMKNFYFPTIMTVTHISQFCCGIERRVLGVLKTQISKPGTADKKKFFRACLLWIASAKLVLSIVLSSPVEKAQWTNFGGPTLLCFATRWLHQFDISTPPTLRE